MSWHQEGPSPPNNLKYQISKRKPQIPHRALHLSNVHVNRNLTNHQILESLQSLMYLGVLGLEY